MAVAPLASAEIFKCVGDTGRITYQNFPCSVDSIGSHQTAAPPPPQAAEPEPTDAHLPLQRGQILSARPATPPPPVPAGEPQIGMTRDQVRAGNWGAPTDISESEEPEGWRETWSYSNNRSVQFNRLGHVQAVQR